MARCRLNNADTTVYALSGGRRRNTPAGPFCGEVLGPYQRDSAGGHGRPPSVEEGFGQYRGGPVGPW
jgi:hypothetical protein